MDSIKSKVAIVTGASSGIGRAYVKALAREGASLVLVGRNGDRLRTVAAQLPTEHLVIAGDVSQRSVCEDVVRQALDRWGRIDILMSNAGQYIGGDFVDADLDEVRSLVDVNVYGAMAIVHVTLPHLLRAGTGDVILTSSVSGHQAIYWEPVYSASKHAIQSFTHSLRRQLIGSGVRVGAIAPGVVLNELWGIAESDETAEAVAQATGMTSEDVSEAALFMLTRPRHVTIRDLVILPSSQEI